MNKNYTDLLEIEKDPIVVMVFSLVKKHTGLSVDALKTINKKRHIAVARQLNMYFICKYTKYTLQSVADIFKRDHATVLHAKKTIRDLIDTDRKIRALNEAIENEINQHIGRVKKSKYSVFKDLLVEAGLDDFERKNWIDKYLSAE